MITKPPLEWDVRSCVENDGDDEGADDYFQSSTSTIGEMNEYEFALSSCVSDPHVRIFRSAIHDPGDVLEFISGVSNDGTWSMFWHSAPLPLVDYEDLMLIMQAENTPWDIDHDS